jgi:hypothetical protein
MTEMILMLGLCNFAIAEIIKHDQKICDMGNKFDLVEIWDTFVTFEK